VNGYTDFHEMFRSEQLDMVVVTVPHHIGRTVIEAAAEHRVHVLKEKPFATTPREAQELAKRCEESGIQLMVTLQRRFNPIYTSFTQHADRIGTPFVVDAQYTLHIADPSEGWRVDTAKALLLQRPEDDFMGGIFELPGGKVGLGEALDTALVREVAEETGLSVSAIRDYLGSFDYQSGSGKKSRQFNFAVDVTAPEPVTLQEHDAYAWTALTEEPPVTDAVKEVLSKYREVRGV
jgi:8-oxo-dGTP pyrophosphatase MutT (NUDIX family)